MLDDHQLWNEKDFPPTLLLFPRPKFLLSTHLWHFGVLELQMTEAQLYTSSNPRLELAATHVL
ncbi:hypothetical protein P3T76_015302 [Phytophthora citrophthora]|uniref:Uncharacterized protein n=1 Tax=Phytophthora citrophthora TaxID=4793 RepID=A0AAD9FZH3_9STRA|nr:hypothetical protein P3T76_015302 [Phytophthora citrophthora]